MKKSILLTACLGAVLSMGAQEHLKSLNKEGLSPEIPASEDFYRYVNQKWMDNNPLTPEYSRYGQFNVLSDSSNNRVRRIVEGLGNSNPKPGTAAYKVASIYKTGMDSIRRNQLGAEPIKEGLAKIENTAPSGMEDLFLWMHKNVSSPFMGVGPMEDFHNSSE